MPSSPPISANTSVTIRPDPRAIPKIKEEVGAGLIKGAQEVVAQALKNTRSAYTIRTGTNNRSIGWAYKKPGSGSFGTLEANGGERSDASSIRPTGNMGDPEVVVSTSSGYGGILEVKFGRFYLSIALNQARDKVMGHLKDLF